MEYNTDNPTFEFNDGEKQWWYKGKLHRENGPAITHPNHNPVWCIHGNTYSFEDYCEELNLTDEDKLFLIMSFDLHRS